MSTKITVNITKEVLERSKDCKINSSQKDNKVGQNCAIGLAIFDLLGEKSWVASEYICWYKNGIKYSLCGFIKSECDEFILLPQSAIDFIHEFDNKTPLERTEMIPFSFNIDIPDGILEEINIDDVKRIIENSYILSFA